MAEPFRDHRERLILLFQLGMDVEDRVYALTSFGFSSVPFFRSVIAPPVLPINESTSPRFR